MCAHPTGRGTATHSRQQRREAEAQIPKRGAEERVVLETIAAAPLVQELAFEILEREADPAALLNRQILEEKPLAVCQVHAAQGVQRASERLGDADRAQVIVESHSLP